jgi:hypothetical protein
MGDNERRAIALRALVQHWLCTGAPQATVDRQV